MVSPQRGDADSRFRGNDGREGGDDGREAKAGRA